MGEKKSPLPGVVITAVIVGVVSGGLFWWRHKPAPTEAPVAAAPAGAVPAGEASTLGGGWMPATGAVAPAPPPSAGAVVEAPSKLKAFTVRIHGALESAIVDAAGKEVGTPLTQVVNRSLVWWVRVPADLVRGDTLSVVYETRDNQEPLVHAVRFVSGKLGKTFEAYRFKEEGEKYPHFYAPDGSQLELQLVDGPLEEWEQITSLLKDGRKHQGVDFKTPSGTPVKATFDGTVVRKTWAFGRNGNSLDIEENGGKKRHALYLHLSDLPKEIAVGTQVKKGQVIGQSGNTGHSFAPHLHYQLIDAGGKLLDPFESHQTMRGSVEPKQKPKLEAEVGRLQKLFDGTAMAGAGGR